MTSDHFRYSGVAGETTMLSRAVSFCFLFGFVHRRCSSPPRELWGSRAFWVFQLLFMTGLLGHFKDLICKALQLVAVFDLLLPLGVEDVDPI
jgi:hypothetical protein